MAHIAYNRGVAKLSDHRARGDVHVHRHSVHIVFQPNPVERDARRVIELGQNIDANGAPTILLKHLRPSTARNIRRSRARRIGLLFRQARSGPRNAGGAFCTPTAPGETEAAAARPLSPLARHWQFW